MSERTTLSVLCANSGVWRIPIPPHATKAILTGGRVVSADICGTTTAAQNTIAVAVGATALGSFVFSTDGYAAIYVPNTATGTTPITHSLTATTGEVSITFPSSSNFNGDNLIFDFEWDVTVGR